MAWALSQIFSVPKSRIGSQSRDTEVFLAYYDIFVRHGLGNYRDVLLETTFSPFMAESLSFHGSKSVGYTFGRDGILQYPDENFAREVMQLFTIGLDQLRSDGTLLLDSNNKTRATYDNDDIVSFSKVWTGFLRQRARANNERSAGTNRLDPLRIVSSYRDQFPKMDLYNGYLGDKYPLCADLPEKPYLRPGAKFRLLGSNPAPELVADASTWRSKLTVNRLTVAPSGASGLYNVLCQPTTSGECSYPAFVELDTLLSCGSSTKGECADIDTLRTVKVNDVFYEYVSNTPCVEQPFFENGLKVAAGSGSNFVFCANPRLPAASEACCAKGGFDARPSCIYAGERMTFATSDRRCKASNKETCSFTRFRGTASCPHVGRHWTKTACKVQVKVNSGGEVSIVHSTDATSYENLVKPEDPSYFRVNWAGRRFPTPTTGGCGSSCEEFQGSCICDVSVTDTLVFKTPPSSKNSLLRSLHIGHPDPKIYEARSFQTKEVNDFTYHSPDGTCCDEKTVFEVTDGNRRKFYLRNLRSTVKVAGTSFSFRNPPSFNRISDTLLSETDVQYETEALIDHLFYHRNTPPFVAKYLLQRFGLSNPSPHLVGRVAGAFRRGTYVSGSRTYGTGKYGDLFATVAVILLDRDSRNPSVYYDPFRGSLREPILKVMSFLRALEFKPSIPLTELELMDEKVGQMAFEQPSVFSFFSRDYSPPGIISDATMVAPELEVMTSTNVVGSLNGMLSLLDNGLLSCKQGFGYGECTVANAGGLHYQPSNAENLPATVDELSTLLTGSRTDKNKKDSIVDTLSSCGKTKTININWMINTYDRMTAKVGDTVVFEYSDGFHNVARHRNSTCDFTGSDLVSETSPYAYTFVDGDVGEVTFACQKIGHCAAGQIVTFDVFSTGGDCTGEEGAWKTAAKLIVSTPEFNTLDTVDEFATQKEDVESEIPGKGTYKAVIHLALRGGCDSFNVLVPGSTCGSLRQEYDTIRGPLAMTDAELLPLNEGTGGQPCSSFGIHNALRLVKELYDDGDLLFMANTGILTEPVTKQNYKAKTLTKLFAHNTHQNEIDTLDPRNTAVGTGTLGRMADVLRENGYRTSRTAIETGPINLAGETGKPQPIFTLDRNGIDLLSNLTDFSSSATKEVIDFLNGRGAGGEQSGRFGELWSSTLSQSMDQTESVYYLLQKNTETVNEFSDTALGNRFKLISQLIQTREERNVDRDFFFVTYGSFDHHSNLKTNLDSKLTDVNDALATLVQELKDLGVWDDVVIVQTSDFARTLTPNSSSGSDHGWGGNHFCMGGSVKGKNILGAYPSELVESGDFNLGRGRIMPTTSWDSIFNGVSDWLDVSPSDREDVLPNFAAFDNLFTAADMFE